MVAPQGIETASASMQDLGIIPTDFEKVLKDPSLISLVKGIFENGKTQAFKADQLALHFENLQDPKARDTILKAYDSAIRTYKYAIKLLLRESVPISEPIELKKLEQKRNQLFIRALANLLLSDEQIEHLQKELLSSVDDDLAYGLEIIVGTIDEIERAPYHHFALACALEIQGRSKEATETYEKLCEKLDDATQAVAVLFHALELAPKASEIQQRILDYCDSIQIQFERLIKGLNTPNSNRPQCFICYAKEKDVEKWLDARLIRDLKLAGIRPIIDREELLLGTSSNDHIEQIRDIEQVIVICTPSLKDKDLGSQLKLMRNRYNDTNRNQTIFPVLYKGTWEESNPLPIMEDAMTVDCRFPHLYYHGVISLIANQKRLPHWKNVCEQFEKSLEIIIKEKKLIESVELENWREYRQNRQHVLLSNVSNLLEENLDDEATSSSSNPPNLETCNRQYREDCDQLILEILKGDSIEKRQFSDICGRYEFLLAAKQIEEKQIKLLKQNFFTFLIKQLSVHPSAHSKLVDHIDHLVDAHKEIWNLSTKIDAYSLLYRLELNEKQRERSYKALSHFLKETPFLKMDIPIRSLDEIQQVLDAVKISLGSEAYYLKPMLTKAIISSSVNKKAASDLIDQLTAQGVNYFAQHLQKQIAHFRHFFIETFNQQFSTTTLSAINSKTVRAFQKNIFGGFKQIVLDPLLALPISILNQKQIKSELIVFGSLAREEWTPFSELGMFFFLEESNQIEEQGHCLGQVIEWIDVQVNATGKPMALPEELRPLLEQSFQTGLSIRTIPNCTIHPLLKHNQHLSIQMTTATKLCKLHQEDPLISEESRTPSINWLQFSLLTTQTIASTAGADFNYRGQIQNIVDQQVLDSKSLREQKAMDILTKICEQRKTRENTINIKDDFIVPLFYPLAALATYWGIEQTNTLDIIDELEKKEKLTPNSAALLRQAVSAIYLIRLRLHFAYQKEPWQGSCDECSNSISAQNGLLEWESQALQRAQWLVLNPFHEYLENSINLGRLIDKIDLETTALKTFRYEKSQIDSQEEVERQLRPFIECYALYLEEEPDKFERHAVFYKTLLDESLLRIYLQALVKVRADPYLIEILASIPNSDGCRQSYRIAYNALYTDIHAMTTQTPADPVNYIQISSPAIGHRYLKQEVLDQIINASLDQEGLIHQQYNALHNVAKAILGPHSLHFKEHPTQPWMDYAICNLFYRLFGHGAVPTELVKATVNKNGALQTHYLQISKTIEGTLLHGVDWTTVKLDHQKIIQLMIGTIVAKPADGRRSNYLMVEIQGQSSLISIDNDASLVDPVVLKNNQLQVLFKSVLFCYEQLLNLRVDVETMKTFFSLNPVPLLTGWITDVIKTQKRWVAYNFGDLESAEETMDALLMKKGQECNLRFFMREGSLFNLFTQLFQLQHYFGQCLREKQTPHTIDLLNHIIGIGTKGVSSTDIGKYVHKQYTNGNRQYPDPLKRLASITGSPIEESSTRTATIGNIPTRRDIRFNCFSIEQSLKEIAGLAGFGGAIITKAEIRTVQANFRKMTTNGHPDELRQQIFLNLLVQIKDIIYLDLSYSPILDDEIFGRILLGSQNLRILNLSNCPNLKFTDLNPILNLSCLEELNLSHCPGLLEFQKKGVLGYFKTATCLTLKKLHLNQCKNLTTLNLMAPILTYLNIKQTPKLIIQSLEIPPLQEFHFSGLFGQAEWEKYFGGVGEEPPLPAKISAILTSPCPIWPDKKVFETHKLVLVPHRVNGVPLTLTNLGELIKTPREGHKTEYNYYGAYVKKEHGDTGSIGSHWVLMTKDVIQGSRGKSYAEQERLVAGLVGGYAVPSALDAAVCILLEHVETGVRLFSDDPWTWTRCQEQVAGRWQVVVGGFASAGLVVCDTHYYDRDSIGIAAARKF